MLIETTGLTLDGLRQLATGDALALRVANYLPGHVAAELAGRVRQALDPAAGYRRIYHSNVRAFTETEGDRAARAEYLASSAAAMAAVRQLCHPYESPVDRLRCELDELWPAGACLLHVDGAPLVFGMARSWQDGAGALPHLDVLAQSAPGIAEAGQFTAQFGVNVYLSVPPPGNGQIQLWKLGLDDVSRNAHGIDGTYGFRYELLPEPAITIEPSAGDLLLLRSNRLHAVRPTRTGSRVTMSGFIGLRDEAHPLRLWS